jgi:DNA-binding NarL/FixJ family response regulator
MTRVLIADDHLVVRKGLKQLLEMMGDVTANGEACNGEEVLAALQQAAFGLLLLDLSMPGIRGVELVRHIRDQHPNLPILVLSMHDEVAIVKRVFRAGASGFITKGSDKDALMMAIRKVIAGGRYIDPVILDQMMFDKPASLSAPPHDTLSERELEILLCLGRGLRIIEIAEELSLSTKTVSTYKARLMEKMNFKTNTELARYVAEEHLVTVF